MKGLIVALNYYDDYGCKPTVREVPGQSFFMCFFSDILSELAPYYWAYPDSPFSSVHAKDESELDFFYECLTVELDDVSEPYSFFPENARWIKDNENRLFGFAKKPDEILVKRIYKAGCVDDLILRHTDVFFCNEDGDYWEFYTVSNDLFEKGLASIRKNIKDKYIKILSYTERENFYTFYNR